MTMKYNSANKMSTTKTAIGELETLFVLLFPTVMRLYANICQYSCSYFMVAHNFLIQLVPVAPV
uniref:Uncharacterized protein n=1 Tax=Arundo donax TaxID=35708 RepID=A0A0A9ANK5_ARUDO